LNFSLTGCLSVGNFTGKIVSHRHDFVSFLQGDDDEQLDAFIDNVINMTSQVGHMSRHVTKMAADYLTGVIAAGFFQFSCH